MSRYTKFLAALEDAYRAGYETALAGRERYDLLDRGFVDWELPAAQALRASRSCGWENGRVEFERRAKAIVKAAGL